LVAPAGVHVEAMVLVAFANLLKEAFPFVWHHEYTRRRHEYHRFHVFWELCRVHRSDECPEGMAEQDELFFAENATDTLDIGHLGTDTESAFQFLQVRVVA